MMLGVNVQLGAVTMSDVNDLRRFTGGALVIVDWPEHVPGTLAVLDAAGVGVGCWRFVTDPRGWPGWPGDYLKRCPWAVFANEPDVEGWSGWYGSGVIKPWATVGGLLVEPAWSDEAKRPGNQGINYDAISAHVYPLGRGTANLAAVRARAGGRPVFVTEAGVEHDQPSILQRLAALGAGDLPTYLYSYRARDAMAMPGYDVAGVALLPAATPAQNPTQKRQDGSGDTKGLQVLQGIDVSSAQPNTGWQQVAQTHQFAFIKATEGAGYTNPLFAGDWTGAAAAGLVRGAYHFARPDINSATAEADYFLAAVGPLSPGDLLVLDYEVGYGDLSGWAQTWLERVAARVGFPPILYTYPSFVTDHGLDTIALAGYSLWYASYQADWPPVPSQWSGIAIWQHSDNAIVPGVVGIVDESYTTLTIDELRALGKPAPVPQPGETPMDALTYFQQLGVKVDPTHAIFTACLKPMWDFYEAHKDDVVDGVVIGDLIKPGALVYPEYGAIWGNGRPAAQVNLQNRKAGVYQDEQGSWNHPYQATLA